MKVSFEINDKAYERMEDFAAEKDISVSEFIRRALLERLEKPILSITLLKLKKLLKKWIIRLRAGSKNGLLKIW